MAVGVAVVMLVAANELRASEKFDAADGLCDFHLRCVWCGLPLEKNIGH